VSDRSILQALAQPVAARGVLGAVLGRLPLAVGVLVIVALVRDRGGSYAVAGFASSAYALGMAIGHPWLGRLADARGQGGPLTLAALASAAGWWALALPASLLPVWGAIPVALWTGLTSPPLTSAMRAFWPRLVPPRLLERAYALDTAAHEVAFVSGPLLLSLLLLVSTPQVAALCCGALVVAGAALFASGPGRATPLPKRAPSGPRASSPLSVAGVRALVGTRGLCLVGLGIALVTIPALALERDRPSTAGLLVGAWSSGALIGGVIYALRSWRAALARRYLAFTVAGALAMAAFQAAPNLVWFAAFAWVSGLALAPWAASGDALMQRLAPPEAVTEAFTWTMSIGLVGEAIGAAVGGVLIDLWGTDAALQGVAVAALTTIALAILTNRYLSRVGAGAPA
jgi:MFS family permease